MNEKLNNGSKQQVGKIAIVGMACLFPDAPTVADFWMNIVNGVDSIRDATDAEWNPAEFYNDKPTSFEDIYCKRGGFVTELVDFDPLKYGVMPKSVNGGDPDQMVALKVATDALADAGYLKSSTESNKYDVILGRTSAPGVGMMNMIQQGQTIRQVLDLVTGLNPEFTSEQLQIIKDALKDSLYACSSDTIPGLMPNVLAGRIAGRFGFKGRNMILDSACASSLTAVELGVRGLLSGQSDMVLAGGIHVNSFAAFYQMFCGLGALSHRQQIRPFDDQADGTMLGEGAGMVVLKRFDDAVRDGNRIYAIVCGIGTSSDGQGTAMLAPNVEGEALAFTRAYEMAGLSPRSVALLEAHGTGTPSGDAAEMHAIEKVFGTVGETADDAWCAIGAVKSMIGHTQAASGIAGLIKVALSLYHKILPKTLNVDVPTKQIDWQKSPCYISTETRSWIHPQSNHSEVRRAAVSAFGFGGVNAHAVLEEHRYDDESLHSSLLLTWLTELCLFGATNKDELIKQLDMTKAYLVSNPDQALRHVAYTLSKTFSASRHNQTIRLALIASSVSDFIALIDKILASRLQNCEAIAPSRIFYFESASGVDEGNQKIAFILPGASSSYPNMLSELCLHFPEVRASYDLADSLALSAGAKVLPSKDLFPRPFKAPSSSSVNQLDALTVVMAERGLCNLFARFQITPDGWLGHDEGDIATLLLSQAIDFDQNAPKLYDWSLHAQSAAIAQSGASAGKSLVALIKQVAKQPLQQLWSSRSAQMLSQEPNALRAIFSEPANSNEKSLEQTILAMHDSGFRVFIELGPKGALRPVLEKALQLKDSLVVSVDAPQVSGLNQLQQCLAALAVRGVKTDIDYLFSRRSSELLVLSGESKAAAKSRTTMRLDLSYPNLSIDAKTIARIRAMNPKPQPLQQAQPQQQQERNQGQVQVQEQAPAQNQAQSQGQAQRQNQAQSAPGNCVSPDVPGRSAGESINQFQDSEQRAFVTIQTVEQPSSEFEEQVLGTFFNGMTQFHHNLNQTNQMVMEGYLAPEAPSNHQYRTESPEFIAQPVQSFPLLQTGLLNSSRNQNSAIADLLLTVDSHKYLADHSFGGPVSIGTGISECVAVLPLIVAIELMAEVASHLVPGLFVIKIADVRANAKIRVGLNGSRIRISTAVRQNDQGTSASIVDARIDVFSNYSNSEFSIVDAVHCELHFALQYPVASAPAESSQPGRAPRLQPSNLYCQDMMYHGPRMRSVSQLNLTRANGIQASVKARAASNWFNNVNDPKFLINPLLLDNVMQTILFHHFENDQDVRVLVPYQIDSIELYADLSKVTGTVEATTEVRRIEGETTEADSHFVDSQGNVLAKFNSIYSQRIVLSPAWKEFVRHPATTFLTQFVDTQGQDPRNLAMAVFDSNQLVGESATLNWFTDYLLHESELPQYYSLANLHQQREWVAIRIAAKEAVRRMLFANNVRLCPADVVIIDTPTQGRFYAKVICAQQSLQNAQVFAGLELGVASATASIVELIAQ